MQKMFELFFEGFLSPMKKADLNSKCIDYPLLIDFALPTSVEVLQNINNEKAHHKEKGAVNIILRELNVSIKKIKLKLVAFGEDPTVEIESELNDEIIIFAKWLDNAVYHISRVDNDVMIKISKAMDEIAKKLGG